MVALRPRMSTAGVLLVGIAPNVWLMAPAVSTWPVWSVPVRFRRSSADVADTLAKPPPDR